MIEAKNKRGTVIIETRERETREVYISKKDVEKYGYTRDCWGCTSWTRGLARQPHTSECRERIRKAMAEDATLKISQKRKREFEEKEVEKKRKKDGKKERKKRDTEENEEDRDAEVEGRLDRNEPNAGQQDPPLGPRQEPEDEQIGEINHMEAEIREWVTEIQQLQAEERDEESMEKAWDGVKGRELPIAKVLGWKR